MNIFKSKVSAGRVRRSKVVLATLITTSLLTSVGVFSPITAEAEVSNSNPGQCPKGYTKIVDDMDDQETLSWVADADYESVILVGGPDNENNNDEDGRNKYFEDVKEGDKIEREHHDISHICAIHKEVVDEPEEVTVIATKIVCPDASMLPRNTGNLKVDENTASNFLENNTECYAKPGWEFQWSFEHWSNSPDNEGELDGWTTSDPTDSYGQTVMTISADDLEGHSDISMREVWSENYLEFAGSELKGVDSAEFYCQTDGGNLDNFEFIKKAKVGETYHCVGWNVPKVATVHAHKIVCTDENEMPNYGTGGPDITEETAVNWVKDNDSCELVRDWEFEWAPEGTPNPDDPAESPLYGYAGGVWNTFGPTDSDGKATVKLTAEDIEGIDYIWVREVLKEGYIPFTYGPNNKSNEDSYSAEMYCHTDVLNYDNYDMVNGIEIENTYHCVAWNMEEEEVHDICLLPDSLENGEKIALGESSNENEKTVQEILNMNGYSLDAYDDQKNYQVWHSDPLTVVEMTVEFMNSYADNNNVFGYYINGDLDTFKPLFKNNGHSDFSETPTASIGDTFSANVHGAEKIGFAIHTERGEDKDIWATENALNDDGKRHAVVYNGMALEEYVIAFEDLRDLGDKDFNDMTVKVTIDDCSVEKPIIPDDPVATVHAHKIVCTDENEMPNYGTGGPDITEETAVNWVKDNDSCELVRDWEFEWAPEGTPNPDDPAESPLYGYAGGVWNTFGPTDSDGKATVELTADDIDGISKIWVREVLKEGYIPFTYGPSNMSNSDSYSAEMYCHTDVLNYDNYDRVDNIAVDNTYYCVAWNMEIEGDDNGSSDNGNGDGDGDGAGDTGSGDNSPARTRGSVSGAYVQANPVATTGNPLDGMVAGIDDSSEPEGQVQGEQDSIIPLGAPNTGMGGTSQDRNSGAWALTLTSLILLGTVFVKVRTV